VSAEVQNLEQRFLRRTRLVVAVNLAAAISGVILLVGGLAYLVTGHQHDRGTERYLAQAMGRDDPGVQYSCLWLFILRDGEFHGDGQGPPGLPLRESMLAVAMDGRAVEETLSRNGTVYRVRTERHLDEVRQAVFDEAYPRESHRELLAALMIAGALGLVAAAAVGAALARRAIDPLEEALDRQRRFVADASHELRAPLTRLHARSQMILRRSPDLPEPVAAELRRMVANTRELGEVVDDLLRSAQLRGDASGFESVDLVSIATELIASEAGRLQERGLVADIQAEAGPLTVPGVESSLRRMVSALVDNAIGHSRPGGRITLTIAATKRGRMVELVVADDGVGLDPAHYRTIFERFARGTAGEGERHGIGLSLAREVAESHGGTIGVTGQLGKGARFTVRLPAAPDGAAAPASPDGPGSGDDGPMTGPQGQRVPSGLPGSLPVAG
jgi:two-component system OmpR family sensor kinase